MRNSEIQFRYCVNAEEAIAACLKVLGKEPSMFADNVLKVTVSLLQDYPDLAIETFEKMGNQHFVISDFVRDRGNDKQFMVILDNVFRAMADLRLYLKYGVTRELIDLSPSALEEAAQTWVLEHSAVDAYLSRSSKLT